MSGLDKKNNEGFRLGPDGKQFTINLEISTGNELAANIPTIEVMKEYWEKVGIKIEIKVSEGSLIREREIANLIEAFACAGCYTYVSESRQYMIDREYYAHGSHAWLNWGTLWGDWLMASAEIKDGLKTTDDFGGELPGIEPPQIYKDLFEWGEERSQTVLGSPELSLIHI